MTEPIKGTIFKIQRFAIHDGPGIRTTVFFKGCPARCWWCSNPESYYTPHIPDAPKSAGVEELELSKSFEMSVDELVRQIAADRTFYDESGGGVTFSGGEPLMQSGFLEAVLDKCKEEQYLFHTALDTTGFALPETFFRIADKIDLVLYDLKIMDNDEHIKYTGIPNEMILQNLKVLSENKRKSQQIYIRMPIIPGINDTEKNLAATKEFLLTLKSIDRVDLLPYHRYAQGKYEKLCLEYKLKGLESPTSERMQELKRYFESTGLIVKIGG